MIRSCLYAWVCLWAMVVYASTTTQAEELPGVSSRDYFSIVNKTSESDSRGVFHDNEKNHLGKALINLRQGKAREAINDCVYVLDRVVNHPKGLAILGFAARLAKEPFLPVRYYERAIMLYPEYAMTHAQYGKYLAQIGKGEEGIKKLQRALEINPGFKVARTWLANLYVRLGQPDLARQVLRRGQEIEAHQFFEPTVVELLPDRDEGNVQGGDVSVGEGEEEKSIGDAPLWAVPGESGNPIDGAVEEGDPYRLKERVEKSGRAKSTK
jgi:tetratricopeptide (TPR) repeat protein